MSEKGASIFKNIVTFGAAGRVDRKMKEFGLLKEQYEGSYKMMEEKRVVVNQTLENVIDVKVRAVKSLSKINSISRNLKGKDREFLYRKIGNEYESVDFISINHTINTAQIAISTAKGVSTGVSTAIGAWALVSTVGTASTGTAIAGLSGVAATNATLAWFGGGAIAAGGGGMAAGALVLGGIVAVPALAVMGVFNHLHANKTINQIESEITEILSHIDLIQSNLLRMDLVEKRSHELISSIEKARIVFINELKRTKRELNRFLFISSLIRIIRSRILRVNFYSNADLKLIAYIGGIATDFAALIDTPVIEEKEGDDYHDLST